MVKGLTTPFSRYRELYGRALDTLKDFPRPLGIDYLHYTLLLEQFREQRGNARDIGELDLAY